MSAGADAVDVGRRYTEIPDPHGWTLVNIACGECDAKSREHMSETIAMQWADGHADETGHAEFSLATSRDLLLIKKGK